MNAVQKFEKVFQKYSTYLCPVGLYLKNVLLNVIAAKKIVRLDVISLFLRQIVLLDVSTTGNK